MRSKIRMFASIARPIESITQAIEARVRVTFVNLTSAIRISEYTISAIPASKPPT